MSQRWPRLSAPAMAPLAVGALLVAVVLASSLEGPWHPNSRRLLRNVPNPAISFAAPAKLPDPKTGGSDTGDFAPVLFVIFGIVALVFVVAVALVIWRFYIERSAPRDVTLPLAAGLLTDEGAPALAAMREGVDDAVRTLDQDRAPRDAVVAAWVAVEEAASASGLDRNPADTPTEFALTVLDRTGADVSAARELIGVYLSARFSQHDVTEADVEVARRCLTELSRALAEHASRGRSGVSSA